MKKVILAVILVVVGIFSFDVVADEVNWLLPVKIEALQDNIYSTPYVPLQLRFKVSNYLGEPLSNVSIEFIHQTGIILDSSEFKDISDCEGIVECPYLTPMTPLGGDIFIAKVTNIPSLFAETLIRWNESQCARKSYVALDLDSFVDKPNSYFLRTPTRVTPFLKGWVVYGGIVYPRDSTVDSDFGKNLISTNIYGKFTTILPYQKTPGVKEYRLWVKGCNDNYTTLTVEYYDEE